MADSIRPSIDQVLFELHPTPVPFAPLRHADEPADGFDDYVEAIQARVTRGDVWASCNVHVLGRFGEFAGLSSCLCGVSIGSAEDFVSGHPEFERLRMEAYGRVVVNITLNDTIFELPPRNADDSEGEPH